MSTGPPCLVATQGTPCAAASITVRPKGSCSADVDERAACGRGQAVDVADVSLRVVLGHRDRSPEPVVVDEPEHGLDDGARPRCQGLERVAVAHDQHQVGELAQRAVGSRRPRRAS